MDLDSNQEFADDSSQMSDETREARYYDKIKIKRTRPQSCDKEVIIYIRKQNRKLIFSTKIILTENIFFFSK